MYKLLIKSIKLFDQLDLGEIRVCIKPGCSNVTLCNSILSKDWGYIDDYIACPFHKEKSRKIIYTCHKIVQGKKLIKLYKIIAGETLRLFNIPAPAFQAVKCKFKKCSDGVFIQPIEDQLSQRTYICECMK